jgi:hypothetical protein
VAARSLRMQRSPASKQAIQQTIIDRRGNCDAHPNSFGPPTPAYHPSRPARVPFVRFTNSVKEDCLCASCLQIECFYWHCAHCDFLPYDIDTIQANLLLQQSCISCPSHFACRATRSAPCRYGGHVFCLPAPAPHPPWRLHSSGV